jgi:signal transduction histidine kinase
MDGQARWRRPRPRLAPEVADGLLGLAVAVTQLLLLLGLGVNQGRPVPFVELDGLAVALIVLQGLPLTWRRRRPLLVFGVVLAANTAYYAIGFPPSQFDFGLPLAVATVAAERDRRTSLAALGAVQGLLLVPWAAGIGPYWASASWVRVLYLLVFFSAMWAWGRYVRIRRAYAEELAGRAERAEREREREAGRAVAAERARIARELHDVIAHHMSVMVIQAGAARRLLDVAPDQARGALAAVEDAGRRGLEAVPGLLRALRSDDRPDGLAPQPTLAELGALVDQVAAAGLPVVLRIEGTPRPLPAAVDLSAYRVAQEALTNTLRHAGPARAELTVRYGPDSLEITAIDNGHGLGTGGQATPLWTTRSPAPGDRLRSPTGGPEPVSGGSGTGPGWSGTSPGGSGTSPGGSGTSPGGSGASPGGSGASPGGSGTSQNGSGHGLIGMRERVRLFGGDLRAGAGPEGGFVVSARFPLDGGPG